MDTLDKIFDFLFLNWKRGLSFVAFIIIIAGIRPCMVMLANGKWDSFIEFMNEVFPIFVSGSVAFLLLCISIKYLVK